MYNALRGCPRYMGVHYDVAKCSLLDGQPQGGSCTRVAKMKASLRHHLPRHTTHIEEVNRFLVNLTSKLEAVWGLSLGASGTSAAVADDAVGEVHAAGSWDTLEQQVQKDVPGSEQTLQIDTPTEAFPASS